LLIGLDEEDAAIILAILVGLQDTNQLPNITNKEDPQFAAPGLAKMIDAAANGDIKALSVLAEMAQQMVATPGDLRSLGGIIQSLVNGERDMKNLTTHMDEKGTQLVANLLEELAILKG
jgi:hypothetical protein